MFQFKNMKKAVTFYAKTHQFAWPINRRGAGRFQGVFRCKVIALWPTSGSLIRKAGCSRGVLRSPQPQRLALVMKNPSTLTQQKSL